ncbi:subtilisin-like protein [Myriangium duriaei CBS 260.36]|uniref:Subtilisin-like protein n=1 Tax=Myriangium duriaei CBS 260.36 TaxID=1168546 RepID=A0A9P4J8C3_9PEZI|nr:subtilisin-like protein [Myriangium duriaei CBS 260.36]
MARISILYMLSIAGSLSASTASDTLNAADKYIVTLKSHVDLSEHVNNVKVAHSALIKRDNKPYTGLTHVYDAVSNFSGYAGHFHPSMIQSLHDNDDIASIEEDRIWTLPEPTSSTIEDSGRLAPSSHHPRAAPPMSSQPKAPWHLIALSHRDPKSPATDYPYPQSAGFHSRAYVLSSGINERHPELAKTHVVKAWQGKGFKPIDTSGHGTHTAALIAGKTYGVAKSAMVLDVKVMINKSGYTSDILAGFNFAAMDMKRTLDTAKSVVVMPVDPGSAALNAAVDKAAKDGTVTVMPAGDGGKTASAPDSAIVVAATDKSRKRLGSSNYGPKVTIFAPGQDITSAWLLSSATQSLSGTGPAAAQVAGVVCLLKGLEKLDSAAATKKKLVSLATKGVADAKGEGLFVYNGSGK